MTNKFLFAALIAGLIHAGSHAEAKILKQWTFEGGQPFQGLAIEGEPPKVVADPKDPAKKVMLSVLKPGAERPERSEVKLNNVQVGEDRWVGVRILRPNAEQCGFTCFFQLGPIVGAKGHGGGGLYQLAAYGKNGDNTWKIRGFMERAGGKGFGIPVGKVVYNEWEDWVFHLKVRADATGLIEVWKNGQPVAHEAGQNAFEGDKVAIKWGVYVGKGNVPSAEITAYFDDITIGDASSSMQEVAPKHTGLAK
jgi:hypothetical protein